MACVALAIASGVPVPPLLVAIVLLGGAVSRWRVPMDLATQRLTLAVVVILAVAGVRASGMPARGPHLGAFGYGLALTPLLLVAARVWIDRAEGTARFDAALSLTSLLVIGGARPGASYVGSVVAFLAAFVVAQRSNRPDRLPVAETSTRARWVGAGMATGAFAAAAVAAFAAHLAYGQIRKRFEHAFEVPYEETIGLSDSVVLGGLAPLLRSDAVVLRVSGPEVERLRGVVLDEYGGGRWTKSDVGPQKRTEVPRTRPPGDDVVDVHHVDPDRDVLFLPLDARDVATPQGEVLRDALGAVRSVTGGTAPDLWFRVGPRDAIEVADPRATDLLMPFKLRAPLGALATEWSRGTSGTEAALEALQTHLVRDYRYSLDPQPRTVRDPILTFLTESRRGHCEYFASAFVLLARSLGIPARVVLGYRVGERNPYFAHYVVRKKNAHAWAEAFVPERGWVTFDPTPMSELLQDLPHDEAGAGALVEAWAVGWERTELWLTRRSVFEYAGAAIFGVVVFAVQRAIRLRGQRRGPMKDGLEFEPPPAAYARFEARLQERGLGRRPGETIERWAERLAEPDLREALLRYARERYGAAADRGAAAADALDRR